MDSGLKAGAVDGGRFVPSDEGTPQGGVISPLLLNIALHGMEFAAGVCYRNLPGRVGYTEPGSPILVRYADDLVALCHSREQAQQVKSRLEEWLRPRGLSFNEGKTSVVNLDDEGYDFLGFNIRRYNGKLLIKPSRDAVTRIRRRLRDEILSRNGDNVPALLGALNPIVHGWSAYYHAVVSKKVFHDLDNYVFHLLYKWGLRRHPRKSRRWMISRYFGRFNKSRNDFWVFGNHQSGGYLWKFNWTRIVRHVMVIGTASVDDPALVEYWARRRRKTPPVGMTTLRLLKRQQGRCSVCGDYLLHADHQPRNPHEWEQWLRVVRKAISAQRIASESPVMTNNEPIRLMHSYCRTQFRQ